MKRSIFTVLCAIFAALILGPTPSKADFPVVTIGNDSGGRVMEYAMRFFNLKESRSRVRFTGSCDSACTMYLGLPRTNVCISAGSSFRFHTPFGASDRGNEIARDFLWKQYPNWVRAWINANGGLTSDLKVMNYAYASRYLPTCA